MKILVCIKAVPDPEQAIHPASNGIELGLDDTTDLHMSRFDEFAVEEAVRIKETLAGTTVDALTIGPENARKVLKRAIGMGADTGIHIHSDYPASCDAAGVSEKIAGFAAEKHYDLIFCGIMSEDMMQFSVGPMLAQRLAIPWATSVIHTETDPENREICVRQEREGGATAVIKMPLPALVTTQSGINEPRYPSLSNMLRADKSIRQWIPADAALQATPSCRITGYARPEKKRDGRVLAGTAEEKAKTLFNLLREKSLI